MTSTNRKRKAERVLLRFQGKREAIKTDHDETVEEYLARGGTIKKFPPGYYAGASLAHPFTDRRTGKRRGGHL